MSVNEKVNFLSKCSKKEKLAFSLASTCAPVIKGLTTSNTLTVKKGQFKCIKRMLNNTCLNCYLLYSNLTSEIVLITRKNKLIEHLNKDCICAYLREFGYEDNSLDYVFERLLNRFKGFYEQKDEFPHELGLILNYPLEDVKGFIGNNGENCLACRYWKVYSNLNEALKIFEQFDKAYETCIYEVVNGFNLKEMIVGGNA